MRKATEQAGWTVDFRELRKHLAEIYAVKTAYYFLGCKRYDMELLYSNIENANFVLMFGDKSPTSQKEWDGDVDAHIVFEMMRHYFDEINDFDKMVLVSGDGDFLRVIRYLILRNKFRTALLPSRKESSALYRQLGRRYYAHLDDVRTLIEYTKKK